MAKISNVRNDGKGHITTGPKNANSYNVKPVNVVATSSGATLAQSDLDNFDFFNVAQTSAGTDKIFLASGIDIGAEFRLYCVSACKVFPVASSGIGLNGGTDAQAVTLAAGSVYVFLKTIATNIVVQAIDASGVVTSPVAA